MHSRRSFLLPSNERTFTRPAPRAPGDSHRTLLGGGESGTTRTCTATTRPIKFPGLRGGCRGHDSGSLYGCDSWFKGCGGRFKPTPASRQLTAPRKSRHNPRGRKLTKRPLRGGPYGPSGSALRTGSGRSRRRGTGARIQKEDSNALPSDLPTPASSDRELLTRHVAGDPAAFGELVRRHRDRLWATALRTLGDREGAADAVQDAFVCAFRNGHIPASV